MKQFGKVLLLALGFGILAAALASVPGDLVSAQGTRGDPNVTVVNTSTAPVLVRDVDNAARHAFQKKASVSLPVDTVNDGVSIATVPAGKLLVIEYVSGIVIAPTGQTVLAKVSLQKGSTAVEYALPLIPQGTLGDAAAGQPTRLYAEAGTDVVVILHRSAQPGSVIGQFTISGYLVDCGAGAGCPLP